MIQDFISLNQHETMPNEESIEFVWAAAAGNVSAVEEFLRDPDFGFDVDDGYRYRAFHAAAASGHRNILELLTADGRIMSCLDLTLNCYAYSPFRAAVENGHLEVVDYLLTEPRFEISPHEGAHILQGVVEGGHAALLKRLLEDPRFDPPTGYLYHFNAAVLNNHLEVVRVLLACARTNPGEANNSALSNAVNRGHVEIVRALLADPRVDPHQPGCLIAIAAMNGYTKIVAMLLEDGRVDPTTELNGGALRSAQNKGFSTIVELLLADKRVAASVAHLRMSGS